MRNIARVAVAALALACAGGVQAGAIGSRSALHTAIGGTGTVEGFEAFNIGAGGATYVYCDTGLNLNSTSVCDGQGPGLVNSAVSFQGTFQVQLDAGGYYGAPSKEILSSGNSIGIDFATAVEAFGVDLRGFTGYGAIATMQVYGSDDTTLLGTVSNIAISSSGLPTFAGWADAGGVGRVVLTQSGQYWSPIIDNVEWGDTVSVPEPASTALLGLGLAALGFSRRRKQAA